MNVIIDDGKKEKHVIHVRVVVQVVMATVLPCHLWVTLVSLLFHFLVLHVYASFPHIHSYPVDVHMKVCN